MLNEIEEEGHTKRSHVQSCLGIYIQIRDKHIVHIDNKKAGKLRPILNKIMRLLYDLDYMIVFNEGTLTADFIREVLIPYVERQTPQIRRLMDKEE